MYAKKVISVLKSINYLKLRHSLRYFEPNSINLDIMNKSTWKFNSGVRRTIVGKRQILNKLFSSIEFDGRYLPRPYVIEFALSKSNYDIIWK